MNIVVSDPKTRKAYPKKIDNPGVFMGKKVGDEVELGIIGLEGYTAQITGGSDTEGFPMKADLAGTARKTVWVTTDMKKGTQTKLSRRGNMVGEDIAQLNVKVIKEGSRKLEELLGGEKKKVEKVSVKEEMVKKSLENVGNVGGDSSMMKKGTSKH